MIIQHLATGPQAELRLIMASSHRRHAHLHLERRAAVPLPHMQPALEERIADRTLFQLPDLTRRDAAASTSCGSGSGCTYDVSSSVNTTLPIAVGVAYVIYMLLVLSLC